MYSLGMKNVGFYSPTIKCRDSVVESEVQWKLKGNRREEALRALLEGMDQVKGELRGRALLVGMDQVKGELKEGLYW